MPDWLRYSANHMWLDVTDDGVCHAGIDAFLSRALGQVERISYVWQKGHHRPTAVLTAGGVDLEIVFPNPLLLTNCNLYLRADPARLTAEPYTGGWLFEGVPEPGTLDEPARRRRRRASGWSGSSADQRVPAAAATAPGESPPMAACLPPASRAISSANRCWPCFMNFSRPTRAGR